MRVNFSLMLCAMLLLVNLFMPVQQDAGAAAPSPTKWSRYESNPVLSPGSGGVWDSDGSWMYTGSVMKDGDELRLYYAGYDGAHQKIGLATSTDGKSWTKYASNPILGLGASGAWDDVHVAGPYVMKDGSTYKMWFHGYDGSHWNTGYATSSDGKAWTKYASNPVLKLGANGDWDDNHAALPCVLKDGGGYRMWYNGEDHTHNRIGYAVSADGISWTKSGANPVLNLGDSGDWDDYGVTSPCVLNVSGTFRMFFSGYSGANWNIGYATSDDGVSWTKYAGNPILKNTGNGWEAHDVMIPVVYYNSTGYYMWYTGVNSGGLMKFGLAEGRNRIPNAPSLIAPSDSSWTTTRKPVFAWTFSDPDPQDDQKAYQVQLGNESMFSAVVYDTGKINSSATSHTPSAALPDGIFYWRARVWDTDGDNSTWSAGRLIKLDSTPPEILSLRINGGAGYTNNRYACLTVSANDPSPGSGLGSMAFSNDGSAWTSWEQFKADRPAWDLADQKYGGADSDGPKQVFVKVRDAAGNEVLPANRVNASIFLDRVAPVSLGVLINSGSEFTNSSDVSLSLSVTDPEPASGVGEMALSNDGATFTGWLGWQGTLSWSLTTGAGGQDSDGQKPVWVKVRDRAGNGAGPVKAHIFLDRRAPEGLTVSINKGAAYANSASVGLEISATDPEPSSALSLMTIANSESALGTWEAFGLTRGNWDLAAGAGGTDVDGEKTVFLKVQDRAENQAGPARDTIFLDRIRPGSLSITINNGAIYTTSQAVTLALGASDPAPASGVENMQFSNDGKSWSSWEPFSASKSYTLPGPDGLKSVHFRVVDRAQNLAGAVTDSIILDTTPPSISNVRVSGLTHNTAVVSWTTDEEAACGLDYGQTSSYGSSAGSPDFLSDHTLTIRNLLASTTYHFRIHATDRAQNPAAFSRDFVFITAATPDTTQPFISDLIVSGITDRLAVASWTTNEPADGTVDLGTDVSYGRTSADGRFVLYHSFTLSGLAPSTAYHLRAGSTDPSGNGPARSGDVTFTTLAAPDTTPPAISNVMAGGITDRLAVVSWTTDEPADGTVEYGTSGSYGRAAVLGGLGTCHEITIGPLLPSTIYHFRVMSRDATGNGPTFCEDRTFTTAEASDQSPPALLNPRIEKITTETADVLWETAELADGYVEYGTDTAYGLSYTLVGYSLAHKASLSGLRPDTTYHVRVRSSDPSGNTATGGDAVFRTLRTPSSTDRTPPAISGIQVVGISESRAVVLWQTDEPADGLVDYGTGTSYGSRAGSPVFAYIHSILLDGLRSQTEYHFRAGSRDVFGNGPSFGPDMRFSTGSSPDLSPPAITGVVAVNITNSSAVITWTTDEPANGMVEYGQNSLYGQVITSGLFVLNHAIQITGLSPNATFHFRVSSTDPALNAARPLQDHVFTTLKTASGTGPSPTPVGPGPVSLENSWAWIAAVLLVAAVLALAAVYSTRRARHPAGPVGPSNAPGPIPATAAMMVPEEEIEVLEMSPSPAAEAGPAPIRHIRCGICRTRIPIFRLGPQRLKCPGCGRAGNYVARESSP